MTEALKEKEGKYLTFTLAEEEYGLEILTVREIIGFMGITPVPRTPEYIKGVINLRGQVIPVTDLRLKFSMPEAEVTDQTCIIVVEIQSENKKIQMGVIVDSVSEVVDIKLQQLEDPPEMGTEVNNKFILAMGKFENKVKILLDIDKVLDAGDVQHINMNDVSIEG